MDWDTLIKLVEIVILPLIAFLWREIQAVRGGLDRLEREFRDHKVHVAQTYATASALLRLEGKMTMYIKLENASRALSEYLSNELGNMQPTLANAALAVFAEYKLQTNGVQIMKMLDDGHGRINLDVLESQVNKYMKNVPDQIFKTVVGEIKVKSDTIPQIMSVMKKYGEN